MIKYYEVFDPDMEYPVFSLWVKAKTTNEARVTAAFAMFGFEDPDLYDRTAFRSLMWRLKVSEGSAEKEAEITKNAVSESSEVEKKLPPFEDDWDMLSEQEWQDRLGHIEDLDEEEWISSKSYYGRPLLEAIKDPPVPSTPISLSEWDD